MGATTSAVAERQAGRSFIHDPLSTVEGDRSRALLRQYEDFLTGQVSSLVRHLPEFDDEIPAFIECRPQLQAGAEDEGHIRRSTYFHLADLRRRPERLVRHVMERLAWPNESFWLGRSTCHRKRNPASNEANSRWCFAFVGEFDGVSDLGALLRHLRLQGIPEPSLIVASGGGFHMYWYLEQPLPALLARPIHTQFLRRINLPHPRLDNSCDQMFRCFRFAGMPNLRRDAFAEIVPGFDFPDRKFEVADLVPGAPVYSRSYMIDLVEHEREDLKSQAQRKSEIRAQVKAANPDVTDWRELNDLVRQATAMDPMRQFRVHQFAAHPSAKHLPQGSVSPGLAPRTTAISSRTCFTSNFPEIAPEAREKIIASVLLTAFKTRHKGIASLIYRIRKVGACSLMTAMEMHDEWYRRNAQFIKTDIETSRREFKEAWSGMKYWHCRRNFLKVAMDNLRIHPGLDEIDRLQEEERGRRGRKKDYLAMKVVACLTYSATLVHPEGRPRLSVRTIFDLLTQVRDTHTQPSPFVRNWNEWVETNPKSRLGGGEVPSLDAIVRYLHELIGLELIASVELRPPDPHALVASSYTVPKQWQREQPGSLCSMGDEDTEAWRKRRAGREKPVPNDWSSMTVEERKDDRRKRMEERTCWRKVVAQVRDVICREIRERRVQRGTQEPADAAEARRVAEDDADVVHGTLAPTGRPGVPASPRQVGVEKDEAMAMALMEMLKGPRCTEETAEMVEAICCT